jgi:hypothetical protein
MVPLCIFCFLSGCVVSIFISSSRHQKSEKSRLEFLEMQADFIKRELKGKIPVGCIGVYYQDMDLGDLMSGKAGETLKLFKSIGEALASAHDRCVDEEQVSIVDDSAELFVYGLRKNFTLRMPRSNKAQKSECK